MRKRIISTALSAAIAAASCGIVSADGGEAVNLIKNGDFEAALLGSGNTWTFTQKDGWFGAVSSGTAEISTDEYNGGASSLKLSNATAGQRVSLSASCDYTLTAYVKGTEGKTAMINIDDGMVEYPDGEGKLKTENITVTDSWQQITVTYSPTSDKEYVICLETWDGGVVYFDDVTLTGKERPFDGGGIVNGDFSADEPLGGWIKSAGSNAAVTGGVLELTNPDDGGKIYQTVTHLENGKYNLSVTANTTGIDGIAYVYAKTAGHTMASTAIPAASTAGKVTVPDIIVENGTCEIGVYAKGNATVTVDNFTLTPSESTRVEFLKGGEISKLTYVEDMGGKFYRADGSEGDALQIMAENGFNLARIRLLDDPGKGHGDGTYYLPAGYMTEQDCLQLARRAKDKGMQILFSFAYSDYWVDGEKQIIPHRWQEEITEQNLSGEEKYKYLENKTYEYTKDVMQKLIEQGTCPEYVSIGNEIQVGLFFGNQKGKNSMWDSGLYNNADMLARFLNAGASAVREVSPQTKIILHSDNGGKLSGRPTFKNALSKVGDNFDVIGVSYYPYYNADVSIDTVVSEFNSLISTYNKDVIVMETGYNWNEFKKGGEWRGQLENSGYYQSIYGETQAGQRTFLTELYAKLKQVSGGRCIGDCYWDPVMIHDDAYEIGWAQRESDDYSDGNVVPNSTIFDFDGKAVEGQKAMKYNTNSSDTLLISGRGAQPNSKLSFELNGTRYDAVTDKFGDYILSVPDGLYVTANAEHGVVSYTAAYEPCEDDELNVWALLYDKDGNIIEVKQGKAGSFSELAEQGTYHVKVFLWHGNGEPIYAASDVTINTENE